MITTTRRAPPNTQCTAQLPPALPAATLNFLGLPLQGLHHYYEPVRRRARRRYSIPHGVTA
jgi:hypothetical protein